MDLLTINHRGSKDAGGQAKPGAPAASVVAQAAQAADAAAGRLWRLKQARELIESVYGKAGAGRAAGGTAAVDAAQGSVADPPVNPHHPPPSLRENVGSHAFRFRTFRHSAAVT